MSLGNLKAMRTMLVQEENLNNTDARPEFCPKTQSLVNYISENLLSADMKWSLFCAACNSYRFDSVLKPFPPLFLVEDETKQIEELRRVIELCPSMPTVLKQLKENTVPTVLKDLLYWVLIHSNKPTFKYVAKEEHQNVICQVSSQMPATMPDFIFSITYGTRHQQKFALSASNYSTRFAFHGSRLDNFYSIINYGLQVSFNKVATFGPGIYLSNEMVVSLAYSSRGFTWNSSVFGSHISIVALCEVVNHPDISSELGYKRKTTSEMSNNHIPLGKYLIVENSDLVRIRYLLVYCSDNTQSALIVQSPMLIRWIKRHKMFTFVIGYIIFLLGIVSYNSSFLYRIYKRLLRKFDTDNKW